MFCLGQFKCTICLKAQQDCILYISINHAYVYKNNYMINKLYLSRFLTKDQTKKKRKANYECSEDKVLFQGVFFTVNSAVTVYKQQLRTFSCATNIDPFLTFPVDQIRFKPNFHTTKQIHVHYLSVKRSKLPEKVQLNLHNDNLFTAH